MGLERKIIVLYPYKTSMFVWDLLELSEFQQRIQVELWDLSRLISKKFSTSLITRQPAPKERTRYFDNFSDFRRFLLEEDEHWDLYIIDEIQLGTFRGFFLKLYIYFFIKAKKIVFLNYGVPIYGDKILGRKSIGRMLERVLKKFRTLKALSAHQVVAAIFNRCMKSFPNLFPVDLLLVAGSDYISGLDRRVQRTTKVILGHSSDYSRFLRYTKSEPSDVIHKRVKSAVFIDASSPMFPGDSIFLNAKTYLTSDVWYPTLCNFFDQIEENLGLEVRILGHYKSNFISPSPLFGGRQVLYDETISQISEAKIVLTRNSTALSYAVLFNKPIWLIYSDQMLLDKMAMHEQQQMAELLGCSRFNINSPDILSGTEFDFINTFCYKNYARRVLTSSSSNKCNFELICDEVELAS